MELEGGLGHLGLRFLEAVSTFLGISISHSLTSQWLVFLSLYYGDTKAYFTVCRKQEGFKILGAAERLEYLIYAQLWLDLNCLPLAKKRIYLIYAIMKNPKNSKNSFFLWTEP